MDYRPTFSKPEQQQDCRSGTDGIDQQIEWICVPTGYEGLVELIRESVECGSGDREAGCSRNS